MVIEGRETNPGRRGRFVELDGLRGLSALLVLIQHFAPQFVDRLLVGTAGVRIFFVLSGFLITAILLDYRQRIESNRESLGRSVGRFYFRRFLRLMPVLYLAVIVAVVLGLGDARHSWPWDVAYLSNFYAVRLHALPVGVGHFWTLAIEEQFYLFWPWVILFVPRRKMMGLIFGLIVSAPLFRFAMMLTHQDPTVYYCLPLGSLDALGLGALLACARAEGLSGKKMILWLESIGWIIGLPLACFGLWAWKLSLLQMGRNPHWAWAVRLVQLDQHVMTDSAVALVGVAAVISLITRPRSIGAMIMRCRPLVYLGTISYGVYVYHAPLQSFYAQYLLPRYGWLPPEYSAVYFFIMLAISLLAASLSWFLMERPISQWKNRKAAIARQIPDQRSAMPVGAGTEA